MSGYYSYTRDPKLVCPIQANLDAFNLQHAKKKPNVKQQKKINFMDWHAASVKHKKTKRKSSTKAPSSQIKPLLKKNGGKPTTSAPSPK
jgi:hypothetical protein